MMMVHMTDIIISDWHISCRQDMNIITKSEDLRTEQ